MKTKLTFFFIVLIFSFSIQAQKVVALHSPVNGVQYFQGTNPLVEAYNAAEVAGDTIYLPGGTSQLSTPIKFEKQLVIYGAGHNPSATTATYSSKIGNVTLSQEASGFHLEGVNFGNLTFDSNESVNNVTIKRCKFENIIVSGDRTNPAEHNNFIENIINYSNISNMMNSMFFNNIIQQRVVDVRNMYFFNNVFLYSNYSHGTISYADLCSFRNNIFLQIEHRICDGYGTSTWRHNIFCTNTTEPALGFEPELINNYFMSRADVLVNQSGGTFDYAHDFHLQAGAASNLGDDGFETGLYGGYYPWKTASIPVNPHISSKDIEATSSGGTLQINFSVHAQDR